MELTPASNATYVYQNTLVAANKQADFQNRLDVQNNAIVESMKDEEKEVEDVRPAEETYKVDADREHEKEKEKEEQEESEKLKEKKLQKEEVEKEHRILDIKV